VVGSEGNLYRIEWNRAGRRLFFQLLGRDEVTPEEEARMYAEWERYMEDYIGRDPTSQDGHGLWLTRLVARLSLCKTSQCVSCRKDSEESSHGRPYLGTCLART
jgi:C-terminal domain of Sin3a protein